MTPRRIKKFVEDHKKEIKIAGVTAAVVGACSYVVYKTKTYNMIDVELANNIIADEIDYMREHNPDLFKTMYLSLRRL